MENRKDIELGDVSHFKSKEDVYEKEDVCELFKKIGKLNGRSYRRIQSSIIESEAYTKLHNHLLYYSPGKDKSQKITSFLGAVMTSPHLHALAILLSPKYRKNFCTDADDQRVRVAKQFEQDIGERRLFFKSSAEGYLKQFEDTFLGLLKKNEIIDLEKVIDKFEQIQNMKKTLVNG